MASLILASATVAREVTLIVPLGLFVITLAWLVWLLHGRNGSR